MKRLNHKTGKPFERGELRYDGLKFSSYTKTINQKTGYFVENWVNAERSNLNTLLADCRKTAKAKNLPFDLDLEYLLSIKVDKCPIFGVDFDWERFGDGHNTDWVPSLDKFYPELGYVRGNVAFISCKANRIKNDATEKELYMVADWFYNEKKKRDAQANTITPVPTRVNKESPINTQLGFVFTAGTGEDDYDLNDYNRAIQWQDANNCAQESGGDSVGCGDKEVGTSQTLTRIEDNGQPEPEIVRLEFGRRYLSD